MNVFTALVFFLVGFSFAAAQPSEHTTDPFQYQQRMASEASQYLSSCEEISFDTSGCLSGQKRFSDEYYEAFEGNVSDQWDVGIMFLKGLEFGVRPDPILACAWWIVTQESGGPLPINVSVRPFAELCQAMPGAADAAIAIEAEMSKVSSLTY